MLEEGGPQLCLGSYLSWILRDEQAFPGQRRQVKALQEAEITWEKVVNELGQLGMQVWSGVGRWWEDKENWAQVLGAT